MKKFTKILIIAVCLLAGVLALSACTDNGGGGGEAAKLSGKVVIRGSTSVEPLMDALIDAYTKAGGAKVADIEFDKDCQGSGAGITAAQEDTSGTVIGMSSSALKDGDLVKNGNTVLSNYFNLALDAIAVIADKNNKTADLTIPQIYDIYTTVTTFNNVLSEANAGDMYNKNILCVSREAGSGTRDAFDGLIKNAGGDSLAKLANGTVRKQEETFLSDKPEFLNSTNDVISKVSSIGNSIGYASYGSVASNATIKILKVGGVEPTETTVLNGTYKLQRPFVIFTGNVKLTAAVLDFIRYVNSTEAQAVVKTQKYVQQMTGKTAYESR